MSLVTGLLESAMYSLLRPLTDMALSCTKVSYVYKFCTIIRKFGIISKEFVEK